MKVCLHVCMCVCCEGVYFWTPVCAGSPVALGSFSLPQVRKCLWVCMIGRFPFHFNEGH